MASGMSATNAGNTHKLVVRQSGRSRNSRGLFSKWCKLACNNYTLCLDNVIIGRLARVRRWTARVQDVGWKNADDPAILAWAGQQSHCVDP